MTNDDLTTSPNPTQAENGVIPPQVVATPSDLPGNPDDDVTWWRPTWRDAVAHLGWRWVLLAPAFLMIAGLVGAYFLPGLRQVWWLLEIKLGLIVVAIVISMAGYVVRQAVRARREPFCIHCGYNLTGLPDHYRCPECGRPYDWRVIEEYRRDPEWFIKRWRESRNLPPAAAPFEAGPVRSKRRKDGT